MRLATVHLPGGHTAAAISFGEAWFALPAYDIGALLAIDDWQEWARVHCGEPIDIRYGIASHGLSVAPVVVAPTKVICCGYNYRAHIVEMGREQPLHPTLFTKFADTLTGAFDDIEISAAAQNLDWEAELAVIVGRPIFRADIDECAQAIAGYTVANDFSVRSWQQHTTQWLPGKALDATTPLGPIMVTTDEFEPGDGPEITCTVNGEIVQHARADDLLFTPPQLLAYITQFTTLRPGDVVLTGTPGGVGAGQTPPRFLKSGDQVVTSIDGIGKLHNSIKIPQVPNWNHEQEGSSHVRKY